VVVIEVDKKIRSVIIRADTAPLAICKAALMAVMEKE
jgi:hypothetical protein